MQTLREAFSATGVRFAYPSHVFDTEEKIRAFDKLLDLPILDGVGLVAMDREAGARKLAMEMGFWHPSGGTPTIREVRPALDAILTACGITVPDEVVESAQHGCIAIKHRGDVLDAECLFGPGDTITITRKEGE